MPRPVQKMLVADIELPNNVIPNDNFVTLSGYHLLIEQLKEDLEVQNQVVNDELKKPEEERSKEPFIALAVADVRLRSAIREQASYQVQA